MQIRELETQNRSDTANLAQASRNRPAYLLDFTVSLKHAFSGETDQIVHHSNRTIAVIAGPSVFSQQRSTIGALPAASHEAFSIDELPHLSLLQGEKRLVYSQRPLLTFPGSGNDLFDQFSFTLAFNFFLDQAGRVQYLRLARLNRQRYFANNSRPQRFRQQTV